MDQIKIGKYISLKRKEKNLTQQQLAEKLGVSNKTISKWETGKNIPDYSIIEYLCQELDISINELLSGEAMDEDKELLTAEKNSLQTLEHIHKLEKDKQYLYGILLFLIGINLQLLSRFTEGSGFRDFISGVMLGLSIGITLIAVFMLSMNLAKK